MNDKIKINLRIADSYYPLTISRAEEEIVREAAKRVDTKLNAYREHYKDVPTHKLLAMVAYQFSLENLVEQKRNDTEPYTTKIQELKDLLENYFKENKEE